MILFKNSFEFNIEKVKIDMHGRFIFIKIRIEDESFLLLNVYGPTKLSEKQLFFEQIAKTLVELDISVNDKIIMAGDWNVILESSIDKRGGREKYIAVPKSMAQLIETYDVVDLWRIQHPTLKRFTFRQKTPLIQSRLFPHI